MCKCFFFFFLVKHCFKIPNGRVQPNRVRFLFLETHFSVCKSDRIPDTLYLKKCGSSVLRCATETLIILKFLLPSPPKNTFFPFLFRLLKMLRILFTPYLKRRGILARRNLFEQVSSTVFLN